jgi:hypothetical protein
LAIFGVDGTYVESSFGGRFIGIGEWRATDERSADLVSTTNERYDFDERFAPPPVSAQRDLFKPGVVALWRIAIDVDETGDRFTATGTAEIQDTGSNVLDSFPYTGYADRMTVASDSAAAPIRR